MKNVGSIVLLLLVSAVAAAAGPPPTITSIAPNSVLAGRSTNVTISGAGFVAGTIVYIASVATTSAVSVINANTITATVASSGFAGSFDVSVTNPDGTSATLAVGFTFLATIASVVPSSGSINGGTPVTITAGIGTFDPTSIVTFGGPSLTITSRDSSSITVTTAAHAAGAVDVRVITPPSGIPYATLTGGFTYVTSGAPPPTIASVTPSSGPTSGGTVVTINGSNFINGATVEFGPPAGAPATTVTFVNSTQLRATTPPHYASQVGVTVINPDGQRSATLQLSFTYTADPAPTITSISPAIGPPAGGTAVEIFGTNFGPTSTVTFGGVAAPAPVGPFATLRTTTPPHASGPVNVVVTNGDGQSATLTNGFTYASSPAPTITSVAPSSGPVSGGTVVTVNGTNFQSGATVDFHALPGTNTTWLSSTSIRTTTPAAILGPVLVLVRNPDGQAGTLAGGFTYSPSTTGPAISSVSPTSGPAAGGTAVTINGSNFASGATVTFGGTAAGATFFDATKIVAVTAPRAAGAVDVVVANPDGQRATLANGFTYGTATCTPPSITTQPQSVTITSSQSTTISVTASGSTPLSYQWYIGSAGNTSNPISGGTNLTLTVSPTTTTSYWVRVTGQCTPAADSSAATVNVNPPGGTAPTINTILPTSGPTTGGTSVTINGSNFVSGAKVSFGGTAASSVTFVGASQIRATAPPHGAGAVSVSVTNPDGQSATLASAFTYTEGSVAVLSFTAEKTSLNFGESTKLRWTTTNASFVSISGVGSLPANGSVDVTPRDTTRYTLIAYSSPTPATAATATNNLTVTVTVTRSIVSFVANPRQIRFGEQATLSWATVRANSVSIDQGEGQQLSLTGSKLIKPLATTTYTLTALGGPNGSETATTTISVIATTPPAITFFTATPPEILEGQSSTLSWASSGGSDADIDNGVNRVATTGTHVVRPKKIATYSLWVNGPSGASTRTVTVRVGPRRPPDIGTLAGTGGVAGSEDGSARSARFRTPWSIAVDSRGNTIVADSGNNTIRRVAPDGKVETIAGNPGEAGSRDGRGREALFNFEFYGGGVATDTTGNIYVSDTSNNTIRKISPDGNVTTIAGNAAGTPGYADGPASEARFNSPTHLVVAPNGTIFVADTSNHVIRKMAPDGVVSTVAGLAGLRGFVDGSRGVARFNLPHGLVLDGAGNLYVGDTSNDAVRKITPDGDVTTLAGGSNVAGKVMTNANSSTTRFSFGCCGGGLAIDGEGLLYVADRGSQTIRTVTNEGEVSTIAGSGTKGTSDGPAPDARFNNPIAVATDSSGRLYIADTDNHSIRATQTPATRRRVVKP